MQDLVCCDYFRTPAKFQRPDIYRFVGDVCDPFNKKAGPFLTIRSLNVLMKKIKGPQTQSWRHFNFWKIFSAKIDTGHKKSIEAFCIKKAEPTMTLLIRFENVIDYVVINGSYAYPSLISDPLIVFFREYAWHKNTDGDLNQNAFHHYQGDLSSSCVFLLCDFLETALRPIRPTERRRVANFKFSGLVG